MKGEGNEHRAGFVAVVGRPNVGKSTLVNSLVGQKVAIVSDKPQTTRNRILGILSLPQAQILFVDTPGIHKPKHKLGEFMVRAAETTIGDVDIVLFVIDATAAIGGGERYIAQLLSKVSTPVILAVNKMDLTPPAALLPIMDAYRNMLKLEALVPVSALKGQNLGPLLDEIVKLLPPGPRLYPEDNVTDQPERLVVAEIIREKILYLTEDEFPHSVAIDVEELLTRDNGSMFIRATVYVERDSQKGIIIGAGGRLLKEIGRLAREDIQKLLGANVYLDLWVKVKKDWRNKPGSLHAFGYRND